MSNVIRLDPSKPADLARLVETGLIWNAAIPVAYKQMAVDALVAGTVPASASLPAGLLDHVNELRNRIGLAPVA